MGDCLYQLVGFLAANEPVRHAMDGISDVFCRLDHGGSALIVMIGAIYGF